MAFTHDRQADEALRIPKRRRRRRRREDELTTYLRNTGVCPFSCIVNVANALKFLKKVLIRKAKPATKKTIRRAGRRERGRPLPFRTLVVLRAVLSDAKRQIRTLGEIPPTVTTPRPEKKGEEGGKKETTDTNHREETMRSRDRGEGRKETTHEN